MTDLNPEQQIAVHHVDGPMLVLAGAGSGKTRVVTARIAHLLEMGIPSSEIVALTFTNRAAEEMRLRVERLCRQTVLTSTFHSLGARI
ncbi:MAG: UvrD-helicase domain-containing protein, partial [Candidatus Doudnabacteria bacterium]|nr:UvrD-helicase domain-containing protein [Candidatus Doudnabacteria bacterium]